MTHLVVLRLAYPKVTVLWCDCYFFLNSTEYWANTCLHLNEAIAHRQTGAFCIVVYEFETQNKRYFTARYNSVTDITCGSRK
jgi:hypothetical protein